jgi:hypothetical protein
MPTYALQKYSVGIFIKRERWCSGFSLIETFVHAYASDTYIPKYALHTYYVGIGIRRERWCSGLRTGGKRLHAACLIIFERGKLYISDIVRIFETKCLTMITFVPHYFFNL